MEIINLNVGDHKLRPRLVVVVVVVVVVGVAVVVG